MAKQFVIDLDADTDDAAEALRWVKSVEGGFFEHQNVFGHSVGLANSSRMKTALEDGKNCILMASSLINREGLNQVIRTLGDDSATLADKRVAVSAVWPAVKVAYAHVHRQWLTGRSMHRLFSDIPEIFKSFKAKREAKEKNMAEAIAEGQAAYEEEGSEEEHSDGEEFLP